MDSVDGILQDFFVCLSSFLRTADVDERLQRWKWAERQQLTTGFLVAKSGHNASGQTLVYAFYTQFGINGEYSDRNEEGVEELAICREARGVVHELIIYKLHLQM